MHNVERTLTNIPKISSKILHNVTSRWIHAERFFTTLTVRIIEKIYVPNVIRDYILKVCKNAFYGEPLPKIEDHIPK